MKNDDLRKGDTKANLTPMIDVVFLLLIFFMVTTSLIKEEADLQIQLPTPTPPEPPLQLSSQHIIDIMPDGSIYLNGGIIQNDRDDQIVGALTNTLGKLKASSDRMKMETVVVVQADPVSPHFKAMQVLDACAASDIKYVSFAKL
jgi:biopolymer transport protein ExbD